MRPVGSASGLIAAIEEEVGATLFSRTTRAVTLTEASAKHLMRIETILAALDEAAERSQCRKGSHRLPSQEAPRWGIRGIPRTYLYNTFTATAESQH